MPAKGQHVLRDHDLGVAEDRIAERDIDTEGLPIELAREPTAKPEAVVLHPVVLDLRVVVVRPDLERHEVAEVLATGLLQLRKQILRRAHHAEVDVLRRACSVEA